MQVGFRLPIALVHAIDAERASLAPPGMSLTMTDVIRVLLTEALAARSKKKPKK